MENISMEKLMSQKMLSLVIDLDQTILHATIDKRIINWHSLKQQNKTESEVSSNDVKVRVQLFI